MEAGQSLAFPRPKELILKVKVKSTHPKKISLFKLFILLAIILSGMVMFNLSQKALIAQDGLRIQKLKGLLQLEKLRQEELILKSTKLKSSQRIERIALSELGMVAPTKIDYIVLPKKVSVQGEKLAQESGSKRLAYKSSKNSKKKPQVNLR